MIKDIRVSQKITKYKNNFIERFFLGFNKYSYYRENVLEVDYGNGFEKLKIWQHTEEKEQELEENRKLKNKS